HVPSMDPVNAGPASWPAKARRSCRRRAPGLPLVGDDVALLETPLATALEGRQHALARQLGPGVGTEIEDLGDLFAVEQDLVLVDHRQQVPLGMAEVVAARLRTVKKQRFR